MSPPTQTTATTTPSRQDRPPTAWLAVTGLLFLSVIPVIGGVVSLGAAAAEPEAWSVPASVAMVAHIVSMSVFCLVGAFQFSPALRTRRRWHRTSGRALLPAGFVAALAAMWLAVFFGGPPEELPLAMIRLVFAVAMIVFLALAVIAIVRRDFDRHGAWMTRGYALAVTGSTQALVMILWSIPFGEADIVAETWLVAAGFLVNSVVAELIIWRRSGRRRRETVRRGALVS